jgi:hypothetical protein
MPDEASGFGPDGNGRKLSRALCPVPVPWTAEQMASLNGFQASGDPGVLTCGGVKGPDGHPGPHGDTRLVAVPTGWRCLVRGCGWRGKDAPGWMADWSWQRGTPVAAPAPKPVRTATRVRPATWRAAAVAAGVYAAAEEAFERWRPGDAGRDELEAALLAAGPLIWASERGGGGQSTG